MSNVVSYIAAAFGPDATFEGRIVDEAASGLEPGHAALMLFVEHAWLDGLEQVIAETSGTVVQEGLLPPEQAAAFRA